MFNLKNITRKNILELTPYSSARDEHKGKASIWLDANENPYDTQVNRYPDPRQLELKNLLAPIKNVAVDQIFIGNGSDEAIDLLMRAFCEPQKDKIYTFPPTYGMYEVSANINNLLLEKINLTSDFDLPSVEIIQKAINSNGILFICSPNNPTGTVYALDKIKKIADGFSGIVVVDEAYIDFANSDSATTLLSSTPNLVVMQTFSKAYGLAGLRLGMAFASPEIIAILNKIKPPYNINTLSQLKGIEVLKNIKVVQDQVAEIKKERAILINALKDINLVKKIYPTEANFVVAEFENADLIYKKLVSKGIVIRNRTSQIKGGLRITIGKPAENKTLISTLHEIAKENIV